MSHGFVWLLVFVFVFVLVLWWRAEGTAARAVFQTALSWVCLTADPYLLLPSSPFVTHTFIDNPQVVNIPSFMVRVDSQKHIDFALTSPFGGGRAGRVKRKSAA
jgi:hypothetical protein